RLRAGGPARRREPQPDAEHPARDHRRDGRRDRSLRRAPGGVHRGSRSLEPLRRLGRHFVPAQWPAVRAVRSAGDRALARRGSARPRLFRLPAASLLAPAAFAMAREILLFTGWAVMWKLIVAILIGFALMTLSTLTNTNERAVSLEWRSAVWLWPFLLGMGAI